MDKVDGRGHQHRVSAFSHTQKGIQTN